MFARIHALTATHSLIKTQIISERKYFPYYNSRIFIPYCFQGTISGKHNVFILLNTS